MKENVLNQRKNGMAAMLLTILLYCLAIVGVIFGGIALDNGRSPVLFIVSMVWVCLGWMPLMGL